MNEYRLLKPTSFLDLLNIYILRKKIVLVRAFYQDSSVDFFNSLLKITIIRFECTDADGSKGGEGRDS